LLREQDVDRLCQNNGDWAAALSAGVPRRRGITPSRAYHYSTTTADAPKVNGTHEALDAEIVEFESKAFAGIHGTRLEQTGHRSTIFCLNVKENALVMSSQLTRGARCRTNLFERASSRVLPM